MFRAAREAISASDLIQLVNDGQIDIIRNLIIESNNESGRISIDLNETDKFGNCPILAAAERNDLAMMEVLVEGGAKVDVKDNFGVTPHGYAEQHNSSEMIDYLDKIRAIQELNKNPKPDDSSASKR